MRCMQDRYEDMATSSKRHDILVCYKVGVTGKPSKQGYILVCEQVN